MGGTPSGSLERRQRPRNTLPCMAEGILILAATPIGDPRDAAPRLAQELLAADIIAAEDVSGLPYDSLAQATGMSKSGLIYHFPTRHNLLVDCHRFCAERWEEELEQLAGGRPAALLGCQTTPQYLQPAANLHQLQRIRPRRARHGGALVAL